MKKVPIQNFYDFLEKLQELEKETLKPAKLIVVMETLLREEKPREGIEVYIIPTHSEKVVIVYFNPLPLLFQYIDTVSSLVVSYILLTHVNRIFLATQKVFILVEE